ncbi:OadG family protein [Halomonas sp. C05BenzN]|uniref:OadG family protein n=1 Tax=Halomonas sp. C05BenzN TaxID=3411041 RepID=UPI003B95AFEF
MQDIELLQEGLALMGLGMGFVFVFLTVLVITTTLMSMAVRRLVPEPAKAAPGDGPRPPARADDELMVVISAALHRYRRRHRR